MPVFVSMLEHDYNNHEGGWSYTSSMPTLLKCPLTLTPQPEGGFTVTSPILLELITGGDTKEEALENVQGALRAVVELYEDRSSPGPSRR
jgi:antitoxin HicB